MFFDFTRFKPNSFGGWDHSIAVRESRNDGLYYRAHIEPNHASYMRGVQIVYPRISKEDLIKKVEYSPDQQREYASFIAWDFKNGIVSDISTAPTAIANYFTKSALPFEMSPAFFKPEVLSKYKSNSDKYRLDDRSISCRNSWHLQTYDINDAGQVHTYLAYLQRLPYEEQMYWKSFNEPPKAPLSKRAYTTDFEGNWHTEYDPLISLKDIAMGLEGERVPWWTLRGEQLPYQLHYPITASPDEWADEILKTRSAVDRRF
jgi:hypothetical protein